VVYVQNPSLVLALLVLLARPFCGRYRVFMDAHNEAIEPFTHAFWPVPVVSRFAIRHADITIVTNSALAHRVTAVGGRAMTLPDRLPTPPIPPTSLTLTDPVEIMVVATYAADEPISEIIQAARQLGPAYRLSITGRETKLAAAERARLPTNVKQTGFLSEHDYWKLMANSHFVLDLTLKPNCLVCGAYEALSLKRPMILSDNPATVDLFGKVAVFPATASPDDIAKALQQARAQYEQLCATIEIEQPGFAAEWQLRAEKLARMMDADQPKT
jgi:glycosyltransferase involved in cell wall biosynthesis